MNGLKIAKYVGLLLTLSGTVVTSVVTSKENESILKKLVEERLSK